MRRLLCVLVVVWMLVGLEVSAQSWEWQNPLPTANSLAGVCFTDSLYGWGVDAYGAVLKTTDGGETWTQRPSGWSGILRAICMVNRTTGYAAGVSSNSAGVLLRTADGGETWASVTADSLPCVWRIVFTSPLLGWALTCGDDLNDGAVRHTTDGGATWVRQLLTEYAADDIQFVNDSTGWVCGGDALVYRTTDGGATWTGVECNEWSGVRGLWFSSPTCGWAFRTDLVFHTTDGGLHWARQDSLPTVWTQRMAFADTLNGWIICGESSYGPSYGRIYRTTNGGASWETQWVDSSKALSQLVVTSPTRIYGCGSPAVLMRTTDGGADWEEITQGPKSAFYGVEFADAAQGWICGAGGMLLHTSDGGAVWTEQGSGVTRALSDITFSGTTEGWAVGDSGTILHTSDGGAQWSAQTSGTSAKLNQIFALDEQRAWAVGAGGTILQTSDGGEHWNVQTSPTSWSLSAVWFADASSGWVTALAGAWPDRGMILHTADGGANWEVQYGAGETCYMQLYDVLFLSATEGYVAGGRALIDAPNRSSAVLKTTDGGTTWNSCASDHAYAAPPFIRLSYGAQGGLWVLQGPNKLRVSADHGATWSLTMLPCGTVGNFVRAGQDAWAVGLNGTILHSEWPMAIEPQSAPVRPREFALSASPNPFNPDTELSFEIPRRARVTLRLYDLTGREVRTLTDAVYMAGRHTLRFDGAALPSGIYFARLECGAKTATNKLVLLK